MSLSCGVMYEKPCGCQFSIGDLYLEPLPNRLCPEGKKLIQGGQGHWEKHLDLKEHTQ